MLTCSTYLFAGSGSGGERAAAFYCLFGMAKLCGSDPEAYLRYVFGRIAERPANKIEGLLRWNILAQLASRPLAA
jgi:transposase